MEDMIDLLNDPDFTTDFILKISTTQRLDNGRQVETFDCHDKNGVIQPAPHKDTQYLDEGDKHRHAVKIWSCEYLSAVDKRVPQKGDIIEWHCSTFRITSIRDWSQYGYWQAIAVQVDGDAND